MKNIFSTILLIGSGTFLTASLVLSLTLSLTLSGCQKKSGKKSTTPESNALRPLTVDERAKDFDQLLELFHNYYGPYQFKEKYLGINIENSLQAIKASALTAKTDEEFASYIMQFGALLRDGHVQIQVKNTSSGIAKYKIPIVVTPVEGHALVGDISKEMADFSEIKTGDEILAVDGQSPFDLLKIALKYRSTASDLSNLHALVYVFQRPSYMYDLIPNKPSASVRVLTAKGREFVVEMPWQLEKYNKNLDADWKPDAGRWDLSVDFSRDFNSALDNHRLQMGQVDPVFLTKEVQEKYNFVKVYPSNEYRKKYDLLDKETPPIYAALYRYNGKTLLLVRSATYAPSDYKAIVYMKAYMALLDQYADLADVLVLDQTHNPGGSYCSEFYNIFAADSDVQTVQKLRADRRWINNLLLLPPPGEEANSPYDQYMSEGWGRVTEQAYDKGLYLTESLPIFTGFTHATKLKYTWKKSMLLLVDELAGSCGDIFPMLVKANHRAKIFGQPTMGLGGNVEEVGTLLNSQIVIRMTRGMFSPYKENGIYATEDFVENNGIKPDYPYAHTIKDYRDGFVDYVRAFSDKAVEQAQ